MMSKSGQTKSLIPRLEHNGNKSLFTMFLVGFLISSILAIVAFLFSALFWDTPPVPECPPSETTTVCPPSETTKNIFESRCKKRIVGYYSSYRNRYMTEREISNLTHLIFAFAEMNSTGHLSFEHKEGAFVRLKKKAKLVHGLKVMFSTGWITDLPDVFKEKSIEERRKIFIEAVVQLINRYHLDGVDFNFEWSKSQKGKADDVILLKEIRKRLEKEAKWSGRSLYTISLMVPSADLDPDDEIYLNAILGYIDFMNFHPMNYYKYWKHTTGTFIHPPLLRYSKSNISLYRKMEYITCATLIPKKLNIPINFYGFNWWNQTEGSHLPWQHRGDIEREWRTVVPYNDETKLVYDGKTAYTLFENETDVAHKMEFAIRGNFGGVTIWSMEFDDNSMTLTNAVVTGTDKFCLETWQHVTFDCF